MQGHTAVKFESKYTWFHLTKYIWKCRLQNGNHFVHASMCQYSSKLCISCRCSTMIDWCVNALMGCARCARMFHWHLLDVRVTLHIQWDICRWNGTAFSHCEWYRPKNIRVTTWGHEGFQDLGHWTHLLTPYGSHFINAWHIYQRNKKALSALQWRHNERDGISNHKRLDCLLNVCSGAAQRKYQSSASLALKDQ